MKVPTVVRELVQVVGSALVGYGVTELVHYEAKLPGNMAIYVIAATGLYYAGVSALERKFPKWAWLLYLLPTNLPTPPAP